MSRLRAKVFVNVRVRADGPTKVRRFTCFSSTVFDFPPTFFVFFFGRGEGLNVF